MSDETYRVLVVDDDPDVVLYTSTVLQRRGGFEVRAISNPTLARTAVDEFRPDVVVTDIEMPGMTGLELIAQLRAEQPNLPIVIVTAHASVDYALGALRSKADEFLVKPVASAELIGVVNRLAAEGRANREAGRPREYVLAVGAHPDDVELGVGGILAAHREAGDTVVILTMSRGGKGGKPNDRQGESIAAAELLGARPFLEDLVDTEITNTGPTIAIVERVVKQVNPTIVYTHSVHDRHQDHRAVHEAVVVAARAVDTLACFQSPSSTVDFLPSRFVSIDAYVEKKMELLQCFRSQSSIRAYLEPDFVLATSRYWSRFSSGSEYCEPLEIIRDAEDLSVQSRNRPAVKRRAASRSQS